MSTLTRVTEPSTLVFIGLGHMGEPMARRLVDRHNLVVFDLDVATVERMRQRGAAAAPTAAAAAAQADFILCSLPTPAAVEQVVVGPNGVLAAARPGSYIVDLSTTDPGTTRRLAELAQQRGVHFVDAPVSGGVQGAADGTLTIMVGASGEDFLACRSLLSELSSRLVHAGPTGAGQMAKLCNNMVLGSTLAVLAEVFTTGIKAGLDWRLLQDVITVSSGGSWVLSHHLPMTAFADDYEPRFALDLLHKDVSLFTATARSVGAPVDFCGAAEQVIADARASGHGERDCSSLIRYYEELAGVESDRRVGIPIGTSDPQDERQTP